MKLPVSLSNLFCCFSLFTNKQGYEAEETALIPKGKPQSAVVNYYYSLKTPWQLITLKGFEFPQIKTINRKTNTSAIDYDQTMLHARMAWSGFKPYLNEVANTFGLEFYLSLLVGQCVFYSQDATKAIFVSHSSEHNEPVLYNGVAFYPISHKALAQIKLDNICQQMGQLIQEEIESQSKQKKNEQNILCYS